jgi:23S rRNA pseudouridine2605 synthase
MVSRLIRTRYGPVAMPTVLKRGDMLELETQAVTAVLDSAGERVDAGDRGVG